MVFNILLIIYVSQLLKWLVVMIFLMNQDYTLTQNSKLSRCDLTSKAGHRYNQSSRKWHHTIRLTKSNRTLTRPMITRILSLIGTGMSTILILWQSLKDSALPGQYGKYVSWSSVYMNTKEFIPRWYGKRYCIETCVKYKTIWINKRVAHDNISSSFVRTWNLKTL